MPLDDYRAANLANWEDRVPIHVGEDGYPIEAIASDPDRLSDVVAYDRAYVGDVTGKSLLHPQCHIGTDTLSWAKLGARVTGIDFSPAALAVARDLASRLGVEATFVQSELIDSPRVLDETFDIVYTGVGAICWLPDIVEWANVMARFTKRGGLFYIRDAHPMLNTLDQERGDDELVVAETYFQTAEPDRWEESHTYAGTGTIRHAVTYEWNHGLGEVISALIRAGLRIDSVGEHRTLDWKALPHMIEVDGRWMLPETQRNKVPLAFSIRATNAID